MGAGFNALAQAGAYNAESAAQHRQAMDMLQRKFLADQYTTAANNIRLPDQQADPDGYKKALDMRSKAMDAAQKVYSPEHHATLGEHIHGLIFGPTQQAQQDQQQQQGGADVLQNPDDPTPPTPGAAQPDMSHPFQHNPVYSKILDGLNGLGQHLKAAANPLPPPVAPPSLSTFAAVPTTTELALKDAQTKADIAEKARLAEIKLTGENAADVARIRSQFTQMSTPQKQFLNRWAVEHDADNFQSLSSPDQATALAEYKKTQASQKPTFHTVGGRVQEFDTEGKLVRDLGPAKGLVITDHSSTAYDVNGNPVTVWNRSITRPDGQPVSSGTVSQQEHDSLGAQQPKSAPPAANSTISNFMATPNPKGLVEPGNLPIWNRPTVRNADGSHSTEYSISMNDGGKEVLVPTVVNGKFLTPDGKKPREGSPEEKAMFQQAWQHYQQTGENLGKFDNPDDADAYAEQLHNRGARPSPRSSQAPSLDATNASIAAANAGSKKLNRGKPVSNGAPQMPGVGQAHRATPFERSQVGQYTKVAEDANAKQASYDKASQQAKSPTPTSDQELIYAWVRSNVQGAGRMTQAEFKQAGGVGSVPMKIENWASLASTGKMTPQLRNFMLQDMKTSADVSQKQANDLRGQIPGQGAAPVSTQAPQFTGQPKVMKFNAVSGKLE